VFELAFELQIAVGDHAGEITAARSAWEISMLPVVTLAIPKISR